MKRIIIRSIWTQQRINFETASRYLSTGRFSLRYTAA